MQPYSDYEIAQRLIERRQNRKTQFRTSLLFLVVAVFVTVVGGAAGSCALPLSIIAGLFVIVTRIDLYYSNPEHAPSTDEIEQEVAWLFGENWHELASAQIYAFAQDRIRKRRMRKWRLLAHLLIFIPLNGAFIISGIQSVTDSAIRSNNFDGFMLLLIACIWLGVFITDVRSTFPNKRTLEKRERDFGETLQFELERLQPEKLKEKEKLKRGKHYQVGDDGELEEVEDEIASLEEKPKREIDNR
jgi:hypothetical protein